MILNILTNDNKRFVYVFIFRRIHIIFLVFFALFVPIYDTPSYNLALTEGDPSFIYSLKCKKKIHLLVTLRCGILLFHLIKSILIGRGHKSQKKFLL